MSRKSDFAMDKVPAFATFRAKLAAAGVMLFCESVAGPITVWRIRGGAHSGLQLITTRYEDPRDGFRSFHEMPTNTLEADVAYLTTGVWPHVEGVGGSADD